MIKKANLSIIILAISLSFHLAVLLFFLKGGDIYALSYDVSFQFFFFLFWSAVLVIFMFLIQTATFFRLFILLRSILFVAITFTFPNDLSLEFFLVTALILEINIYESFPYNLVFSIGCIVLGIYANYPSSMWDTALSPVFIREIIVFGSVTLAFTVIISLVNRYREITVNQDEHILRLGIALNKLNKVTTQFQQYANTAWEQATLDERKRITRQIHDVIGYTFTNLIMMMEAATDLAVDNPKKVTKIIGQARDLAQTGFEDIRSELHALRTIRVEKDIGINAINKLIKIFEEATMVSVDVHYGVLPATFGDESEKEVYHIIQESLINAFRHGKATHIDILMQQINNEINILISDNGIGAGKIEEGIGMQGMRERLELINGRMEIRNIVTGFAISAWVPVKKKKSSEQHFSRIE
jgi:signal transduction histidine kinase